MNDLERLLMWHVGQMRNRDNATAVGGSFDLGFSGNGARIGMSARRRTWLTNGSTFEVTGGGAVAGVRGSTEVSRHVNRLLLTGSAELAHDDVLALIVRGDVVPGSRTTAALYGGAELRSTLAVVGTGVGAILLGLFIWALSKSDF